MYIFKLLYRFLKAYTRYLKKNKYTALLARLSYIIMKFLNSLKKLLLKFQKKNDNKICIFNFCNPTFNKSSSKIIFWSKFDFFFFLLEFFFI